MGIKGAKSPRKKVGLALSSGAARGLAHIGVLEVMEREGIPIDMIAGTSMGALIGAVYAQSKDVSEVKNLAIELGSKRFSLLVDLALPKTGLLRGRKVEDTLRSVIGDIKFKDLRVPFACVATDIGSGEEVVIKRGSVWKGVRASASIPVIFTVAKWEGRYLVDGGLVNPVPVSVLRAMGADFIIAVSVIPYTGVTEAKEPNIFNVIMQTVNIASYRIIKSSLSGADIVIEPQVGHIAFADFHRAQECIIQGELAAQDSIAEIQRQYLTRRQNPVPP